MNREPVLIIGAVTAVIEALLGAAVLFGLDWTEEQTGAVMGLVLAVGTAVATFLARSQVTPVSKE